MSGPKYSRAVIETRRLQKIMEDLAISIENSKRAQLMSQIKAELKKITESANRFKTTFDNKYFELGDKYLPGDPDLVLLREYYESIISVPNPDTSGKNSDELSGILSSLLEAIKAQKGQISVTNSIRAKIKQKIDAVATDEKAEEFSNTDFGRDSIPDTLLSQETYSLYLKVLELISGRDNYSDIKSQIDSIINNHNLDEGYKQKQLKIRIESLKATDEEEDEKIILQSEIAALLSLIGNEQMVIPDTLEELRELKASLTAQVKQEKEDEYISDNVAEVLSEIGYNIVKTETVRTTKRTSKKRVCDFSEDSVLQVSTSSSGAVMFEVMSRKKPDDITPEDKHAVKADMDEFCPDYALIKKKLAERGITLTNEQLSEAAEKYVRGSGFGGTHKPSSSSQRRGKKGVKHNVID